MFGFRWTELKQDFGGRGNTGTESSPDKRAGREIQAQRQVSVTVWPRSGSEIRSDVLD